MVRSLLVRGMLAGLIAGVVGFLFARLLGEPSVNTAIAFESYVEYTVHDEVPEAELVSRPIQSSAGLTTGTVIYGAALGGVFALVFAAAYGRLGPLGARGTAAVLGGLGFTAVFLVPFLKYPANPPSVGNPDTLQYRTAVYLVLFLFSIVAMVGAAMVRQRLVARFGGWDATLIAGGAYLAVVIVCYAVFPGINEVPQQALPTVLDAVTDADVTFPPSVLWAFRLSAVGLQALTWATLALVFGALAQSQLEPSARRAAMAHKRAATAYR
jgi:hypothetical protein